jgi:Fe-S cluster assembly protein SufD
VGALDKESLFYLRSRGVPHEEAKALLTYAFAHELLDRIQSESLRTHVEMLVSARLSTDGNRTGGTLR